MWNGKFSTGTKIPVCQAPSQPSCDSKWPFRQSPIAVRARLFFRRDGGFGPFLCVLGAVLVAGVVAEPELHVLLAPTAKEVVKPAAARVAAREMGGIAQAALPECGVKFAVIQVVGVQQIETSQGEVVKQFPENWRERFVRDFRGREQWDVLFRE